MISCTYVGVRNNIAHATRKNIFKTSIKQKTIKKKGCRKIKIYIGWNRAFDKNNVRETRK